MIFKIQHKARIKKLDASRVNFENLNIDFDNRVNILFQEAISKPKIDFFLLGLYFCQIKILKGRNKNDKSD